MRQPQLSDSDHFHTVSSYEAPPRPGHLLASLGGTLGLPGRQG